MPSLPVLVAPTIRSPGSSLLAEEAGVDIED